MFWCRRSRVRVAMPLFNDAHEVPWLGQKPAAQRRACAGLRSIAFCIVCAGLLAALLTFQSYSNADCARFCLASVSGRRQLCYVQDSRLAAGMPRWRVLKVHVLSLVLFAGWRIAAFGTTAATTTPARCSPTRTLFAWRRHSACTSIRAFALEGS